MLQPTLIVPQVVHRITFSPRESYVGLMDSSGIGWLFFATLRPGRNAIVVNDLVEDKWGQEITLLVPGEDVPDRYGFEFKFNGRVMEVWNSRVALEFPRFDQNRAAATRFSRVQEASNRDNSLRMIIGSLDATLTRIESHLLHRRIDVLETRFGGRAALEAGRI